VKGEPEAVGLHTHTAEVPEIVTAPDDPHEVMGEPPTVKVTVPLCPAPVVAVNVMLVPSSFGEEGEAVNETVESCFVIVNVADLLEAYQLSSPAFCAIITHVPLAFCAVTVSPRVPDRTQSLLLVVKVSAPMPLPPEAVSAVGTP
jgi:hypothetical protein